MRQESQGTSKLNLNLEKTMGLLSSARAAYEDKNWVQLNAYLEEYLETPSEQVQQQALPLAIALLLESDFTQRWEVAKLFKKIGTKSLKSLIELAEDENTDNEIRWFACRILGEFNEQQAILTLTKLLQNPEEEIASVAAQGLANIGSNAIELLSEQLKEVSSRRLVVQALAGIPKPEVIAPLLSVVSDADPEVRACVIEALGNFRQPRITQVLIDALKDTSAKVRKEALTILGRRGDLLVETNLVAAIKPLLYDFNVEVCTQAGIALGRLGTPEAAEAVFEVIITETTSKSLKIALMKSLLWIETTEALLYQKNLLYISETSVVVKVIEILGRIEYPHLKRKAAEILVEFLNSQPQSLEETEIRQAIANSLGELGEPTALKVLEKLTQDPEAVVKLHAQAAIKKLA